MNDDGRQITRSLADIAHALESVEGVRDRVIYALERLNELVPYRYCVLLIDDVLYTVPALEEPERSELHRRLAHAVELPEARATEITVAVTDLDRVGGVLYVSSGEGEVYDSRHHRMLGVIASQLGAYFASIRLRAAEAQRAQELAAINEFQQVLVGTVSHDLRNPLAVIVAGCERLLDTATDLQRVVVARVLRSAHTATRIISDLLDVTQARVQGGLTVDKRSVELVPIVRDLVDDLRLSNPERTIELVTPYVDPVVGHWDPDRITQALGNLVANALRHGDHRAPIRIELVTDGDRGTIRVHNRGVPIPGELLPHLFDPFRAGTASRKPGGGLGLGLYIVSQIVRAHGGSVTVQSTAEHGTELALTLPRSP